MSLIITRSPNVKCMEVMIDGNLVEVPAIEQPGGVQEPFLDDYGSLAEVTGYADTMHCYRTIS